MKSECRLSNGIRPDTSFVSDHNHEMVFMLYPEFETLSETSIVGNEWEALDEGTAIIMKPILDDMHGYYQMIQERVRVGAKAHWVAGSCKIAELEVTELLDEL